MYRSICCAALGLGLLSGCRESRDTASTPAAARSSAARPSVVSFTATDFGFHGPSSIPSGTTVIRLSNQGQEIHHMVMTRWDEGKTYDSLLAALGHPGPPPPWMRLVGGPNAVDPGRESNATQVLEPGHYALICFIPSPDGVPHLAKGMVSPLEVTASPSPAETEPPADVVIRLTDYAFDLSAPLVAGSQVIRVENVGPQPHELVLAKFGPGASVADFEAWQKGGEKGPIPGIFLGGVAPMDQGKHGQFSVDLQPGNYALLCFLPDSKDGNLHFLHGMVKPFTVG